MAWKCPRCKSENTDSTRFCSRCAAPLSGEVKTAHSRITHKPIHDMLRDLPRFECLKEKQSDQD